MTAIRTLRVVVYYALKTKLCIWYFVHRKDDQREHTCADTRNDIIDNILKRVDCIGIQKYN